MRIQTFVRPLLTSDHDEVFTMMADQAAVTMAAFTAEDSHDRVAFDLHMHRVAAIPGVKNWAVVGVEEMLVGTISTFPSDEKLSEVTYWIERAHWGHGHASRALALVLPHTARPVLARVAYDNHASRRVLQKAGFVIIGQNRDYAAARRAHIDELILRLD
jgi:RimJ/RimL family protein N-acetyltransferase